LDFVIWIICVNLLLVVVSVNGCSVDFLY